MIPSLALQAAVRAELVNDPYITERVAPEHIRSGEVRPDQFPAILLLPTRTEILGRAAGGQIVAEARILLNIWAHNDGTEIGPEIAAGVFTALMDAPEAEGFEVDSWDRPNIVWFDSSVSVPNACHGTVALRAQIRWRE